MFLLAEDEKRHHASRPIHVSGLCPPILICGHQPGQPGDETEMFRVF